MKSVNMKRIGYLTAARNAVNTTEANQTRNLLQDLGLQ